MWNKLTTGDRAVFVITLIFVLCLYAIYWGGAGHARHAEVVVAGKKQFILDLADEKTVEINGILGRSIIEIKDGQIRFVESPCSSKLCIRSGWVSQVNALTACLPNGISIHLTGPNARFDSINF